MKVFYNNFKNAIGYALSDWTPFLVVGTIIFITSIIRKNPATNFTLLEAVNVLMLIVVGYGSYISWHTIRGSDKLPEIKNIKKLLWEGFKKSCILFIYTTVLTFLFHHMKLFFSEYNIVFTIIFGILFVFVYLILIGGLINRYLHHGNILQAFNVFKIIKLLLSFDVDTLIRVVISAVISQLYAFFSLMDFVPEFSLFELLFSILMFLLAPFLFIAAKRLVGLHVREFIDNLPSDQ